MRNRKTPITISAISTENATLISTASSRPEAVRAYSTPAGTVVLAVAAALSIAAYVAMKRIGRLPADERMAQ